MRRNIEVVPQALKVLIEVQDVDASILGGGGDGQIREREAMGAMGTVGCQLAHRCQDRTLHAAINRNLAQALQRALDRGDPVGSSCIDHQLVAH